MIQSNSHYLDDLIKDIRQRGGIVSSTEFHDCEFQRCSFVETVFENCRFVDCLFQDCDLSLVQLPDTTLTTVRFERSRVIGVDWTLVNWSSNWLGKAPSFVESTINHSTFIGLSLEGLIVKDCSAIDVDFREADLTGVDFSGSDLGQSLFGSTILAKANLAAARNYQIDPTENRLTGARFALPEAMSLLFSMDIELLDEN